MPWSFSIALHLQLPTRAQSIHYTQTKLLLTRQKEIADMTKKGSLGSYYNYIHHLSHDLLLQIMTRVQPPLAHAMLT